MSEGNTTIKKDVETFIAQNKEKYESITTFQDMLNNLKEDSYSQTIDFIEKNKLLFFKDHHTSLFYIYSILDCSINNFKNFELVLDIFIHFSDELKANITEIEIIGSCKIFLNSINYLFLKGFFSIDTIISKSFQIPYLFFNFLPEIEQYDPELANLRKKIIIPTIKEDENLYSFYKSVISDYHKHIINRNLNYHPSILHKSIRDDDIDTFQMLVSQNNYNINKPIEFSFYERTRTIDEELPPIKIAAVYGSLKIFKFLMMNNANFVNNVLCYAYFGANIEIIHLLENKCSHKEVCIQPIITHNKDLLDYFIDNFGNELIETYPDVKNYFQNCNFVEDEDNPYKELNSDCLHGAVISYNYPIIISCLEKIILIAKNVETQRELTMTKNESFLFESGFDFDLFKFIFSQCYPQIDNARIGFFIHYILTCNDFSSTDIFKVIFLLLKDIIQTKIILKTCIENNVYLANYVLDFQLEEMQLNNNPNSFYNALKKQVNFYDIIFAISKYNEDVIAKMILLYDILESEENILHFINCLKRNISNRMIKSLFQKIEKILPKEKWIKISTYLNVTNNKQDK